METEHHSEHQNAEGVELPTPTAWPMIAALGIMLIAGGFVTSIVVSMVGFLLGLIGGIGWFRALFPLPSHEFVPFVEPAKRPAAIKVSPRRISHLSLGMGGHRAYYPAPGSPIFIGDHWGISRRSRYGGVSHALWPDI